MSRPLAPHEIAEQKARESRGSFSPVLGRGVLASLGCITWIGAAALISWIAWSLTRGYGAVLGDQHLFWVIGASVVFLFGFTLIWSAIAVATRGRRTPIASEDQIDGVETTRTPAGRTATSRPEDDTSEFSSSESSRENNVKPGCQSLIGIMVMTISGSILVLPLLSQEQILRLSLLGDLIGALRADRVSEYIDRKDYESARRLGSLGLGRNATVNALPKLSGELVLAEILLMSGADPDSRDTWGDTLLMEVSDPLFAERLLVHGASPHMPNDDGRTAGEEALARWDFGVATKLVDPSGDGAPLADAIRRGDHEELARLLDGGTDPDSLVVLRAEHDYELSPLYYAAAFRDLRAVNLLLDAGASQDVGLVPPLVGAAESRSTGIATRLVEAGAIIDYHGRNSTDALSRAIEFNAREMVEHLISLGAGRAPEYYRVVSLTNDPEIRAIVESTIIDPNLVY